MKSPLGVSAGELVSALPWFQKNQDALLIGSDLLAKVKALGNTTESDLVRECGDVSTKKDGGKRLNCTAFYEALLGT